MPRIRSVKTNFTAGEISPELIGRGDLTAYANGASQLRNVRIHPTGGVSRRPGLAHVAVLPGAGRLVAFEFNTQQVYLLVFSDRQLRIFEEDRELTRLATPWTEAQIGQINWTQSADTLLIVHPELPPRTLTRHGAKDWRIARWRWQRRGERLLQPHYKFAPDGVSLRASGRDGSVTLSASGNVFQAGHRGCRFRLNDREVEISAVTNARTATARVHEKLDGTGAVTEWSEQGFSPVRGWPVSVCFHQDRLVIGGSRDLPNRLWLSQSADLYNFDTGEGEDDEAIEFAILSDQVNAVRNCFSGRHLQVFTSGAEWMVTGDPLTPTNIQLKRQTRVGSPVDRTVPPRDVDGATLFISRSSRELREFLFADVEQAYRSNDLAILSRHLMRSPVDQDFDPAGRLMYLVMADGTLAAVTIFRPERVTAWSLNHTDGAFEAVSVVAERVYVIVRRGETYRIERFDAGLSSDGAVIRRAAVAQRRWGDLDHLEGREVTILADGIVRRPLTVRDGEIELAQPAREVEIGLAFEHVITPLPVWVQGIHGAGLGAATRLLRVTFRLLETAALSVDVGAGQKRTPFTSLGPEVLDRPVTPITGDKTVRALGWSRGGTKPLWEVRQDTPLPCTVLSVMSEISTN